MMDVRPIRNEEAYRSALAAIEAFDDNTYEPGTPESDRLDVLVTLVKAYEEGEFPIPKADPVDVLQYAISDLGRSEADLAQILGSKETASRILSRHEQLTLEMIRAIHEAWHLPLGCLAERYRIRNETV